MLFAVWATSVPATMPWPTSSGRSFGLLSVVACKD